VNELIPRLYRFKLDSLLGEIAEEILMIYRNMTDLNPRLNYLTTSSENGLQEKCMKCLDDYCTNCRLPYNEDLTLG